MLRRRAVVGHLLSPGKIFAAFPRSHSEIAPDGRERTYIVEGELFFASTEDFMAAFDFREALERVTIDVRPRPYLGDISSVAALDMAVLKFRAGRRGGRDRLG